MKYEPKLLQECLEHLSALPNIQATYKNGFYVATEDKVAEKHLIIDSPLKSVNYICNIQPDITIRTAELVIAYFKLHQEKLKEKLLLITRYLSETAIEKLVKNDIEFIDTAGNIYLNSPAAYILIRGKHRPKEKTASQKQITPNNLKVIYTLLKSPNILKASLKELANAAGVTSGIVNNTLKNLYDLGYLQRQREGYYRIAHYGKLLERWEIGYAESLRPNLLLGTFTPVFKEKFAEVSDNIIQQAKENNFLIGGELGAAIATSYLSPLGAVLHVKDNHRLIAAQLKLKPSSEGEIIFLQQFGSHNADDYDRPEPIADPLLIHAELMIGNNERLEETAKRIFANFIEARQQNA
jgi:hypothetical protein